MQSARRFAAILSLTALSALHSHEVRSQEGGGFQVPLNAEPVDTTTANPLGFFIGTGCQKFVLSSDVFPRRQARPSLRQPKAGEHLGDYLVADKLPVRYELPPELPQPKVTLLPPVPVTPAIEVLPPFGQPGYGRTLPPATKSEPVGRTSICFTGPTGMKVSWQLPDGSFKDQKDTPTRQEYNFARGQVYRLRLANVLKEKPGRVFYPTLEVPESTVKTAAYLKHSSVPVTFTADDFAQANEGILVVKVIYLPDPTDHDFSTVVGAEEVVSTRLEPGIDPIVEAQRRGTVLAIIRMGNIDLENSISPALHGGQLVPGITPGSGVGRIIPLPR